MQVITGLLTAAIIVCTCLPAQDLNDPNPKQRIRAAKALARAGAEAIPQLTPLLKDSEAEVRREAVRSIISIGTQHSLDPLIEATCDNDPEVQLLATDGIVNFYLPGYIEKGTIARLTSAVRGRFDRENTQIIGPYVAVRPDAIAALGRLSRGGVSMEARANAARAIGILRGREAIPDLLEALRSKDDTVMYESLIALQKIGDRSAGPRVLFLLRDLSERVQTAAIDTVGLLKTKEAVPELHRVYDEARSDKVRRSTLTALSMLADPSSRPYFERAFTDRDEGVRASAAEGYGRLRQSSDRAAVEKAFNSEKKMGPRLALAFAAVSLGNVETAEFSPLTYLVNSLNSRAYRGVAEPYLVELAREDAVRNALHAFLQRPTTREEKIGLARVLGASGDQESLRYVEALTKDPDTQVAEEGIRAMRTLQARLK